MTRSLQPNRVYLGHTAADCALVQGTLASVTCNPDLSLSTASPYLGEQTLLALSFHGTISMEVVCPSSRAFPVMLGPGRQLGKACQVGHPFLPRGRHHSPPCFVYVPTQIQDGGFSCAGYPQR
ncbi:hypothetical protein LIA77_02622 [Sarocladium implicatum]|nr:hypothetical protein LIA77_02622 [Sarocladium implicatum]